MKGIKAAVVIILVLVTAGMVMTRPAATVWLPAEQMDSIERWPAADEIDARQYCVLDSTTGQFMIEFKADEPAFPASTTKIMTAVLALEAGILDQMVTVSAAAVDIAAGSSKVGLIAGEEIRFKDVLAGMMTASGNDAANVVAETLGGSQAAFADLMNSKAAGLGLGGTHFVNAHGLHDAAHVTTARDMATLAAYAMKNEQFRELAALRSYVMPVTNMHPYNGWGLFYSTNNFLRFGETALKSDLIDHYSGIKTGTTTPAGVCLVSSAVTKTGHELIAVVFGVPGKSAVSVYAYSRTLLEAAAQMIVAAQPTATPEPTKVETDATTPDASPAVTSAPSVPVDPDASDNFYTWQNPWYLLLLFLLVLLIVLAIFNLVRMRRRRSRNRR